MWVLTFLLAQVVLEGCPDPYLNLKVDGRAYLFGDSVRVVALVSNQSDDVLSACYQLGCSVVRERTRADSGEELFPRDSGRHRVGSEALQRIKIDDSDTNHAREETVHDSSTTSPSMQHADSGAPMPGPPCSPTEFHPALVWVDSTVVSFEDEWEITTVESVWITVWVTLWAPVGDSWQWRGGLKSKPIHVTPLSPNSPLQPAPAVGVD